MNTFKKLNEYQHFLMNILSRRQNSNILRITITVLSVNIFRWNFSKIRILEAAGLRNMGTFLSKSRHLRGIESSSFFRNLSILYSSIPSIMHRRCKAVTCACKQGHTDNDSSDKIVCVQMQSVLIMLDAFIWIILWKFIKFWQ